MGGMPEEEEIGVIPGRVVDTLVRLRLAKVEEGKVVFYRPIEIYASFMQCVRLLSEVFKVR
jgi:hypothetical protein